MPPQASCKLKVAFPQAKKYQKVLPKTQIIQFYCNDIFFEMHNCLRDQQKLVKTTLINNSYCWSRTTQK